MVNLVGCPRPGRNGPGAYAPGDESRDVGNPDVSAPHELGQGPAVGEAASFSTLVRLGLPSLVERGGEHGPALATSVAERVPNAGPPVVWKLTRPGTRRSARAEIIHSGMAPGALVLSQRSRNRHDETHPQLRS